MQFVELLEEAHCGAGRKLGNLPTISFRLPPVQGFDSLRVIFERDGDSGPILIESVLTRSCVNFPRGVIPARSEPLLQLRRRI